MGYNSIESEYSRRKDRMLLSDIEREFSEENIEAYGEAPKLLAYKTLQMVQEAKSRMDEARVTVLNPSRGANPLLTLAALAIKDDPFLNDFARETAGTPDIFEFPGLDCFNIVSRENNRKKPPVRVLVLPFTADASSMGRKGLLNSNEMVDGMRRYMTTVAAEILFNKYNLRSLQHYTYMKYLEAVLGKKGEDLAKVYQQFEPVRDGEKVLYVDTAISGMASNSIMEYFNAMGIRIDPIDEDARIRPFIIVDRNGNKLSSKYNSWINYLKPFNNNSSTIIEVPRIISEDRRPFLGTEAVMFPGIIKASLDKGYSSVHWNPNVEEQVGSEKTDVPCFGVWRNLSGQADKEAFHTFINMVRLSMRGDIDEMQQEREKLINILKAHKLLAVNTNMSPREVQRYHKRGLKVVEAGEQSSHIVVVNFGEKDTKRLVRDILPDRVLFGT